LKPVSIAAILASVAISATGCSSSQEKFVSLSQRDLNSAAIALHGVRGARAYGDHADIIVDGRYGQYEGSARILGFAVALETPVVTGILQDAAKTTNFRLDPTTYAIRIVDDAGHEVQRRLLDDAIKNALDPATAKIFHIDHATLAASSTPAPLAPLQDRCGEASRDYSTAGQLLRTSPSRSLDLAQKALSANDECFSSEHIANEAYATAYEAMAEHALRRSSAVSSATLAGKLLTKCADTEELYATREGAACQRLSVQMFKLAIEWQFSD
jgi:hypothetical protein